SSVIVPGDVVEIEVDAPTAEGAPSSGRLRTTVVQGETPFDPALGSMPAVDDLQREEAWGSREAAGLSAASRTESTGGEAPVDRRALSPELREKLLDAPTAGLSSQLRKRGLHSCFIDGV